MKIIVPYNIENIKSNIVKQEYRDRLVEMVRTQIEDNLVDNKKFIRTSSNSSSLSLPNVIEDNENFIIEYSTDADSSNLLKVIMRYLKVTNSLIIDDKNVLLLETDANNILIEN